MNLVEYPDREILAMQVADRLAGELKTCLTSHDHASLAVPGGSTPGPIFDILGGIHFDWAQVHVMLTDERWVPENDARSNSALVKQRLLSGAASEARFIPFYREGATPEEGAAEASAGLKDELPLSLLVLGMGADMHSASLFPGGEGTAAAMANGAPPICPVRVPGEDIARVTLSAEVLKGAMSTHLVIYGEDKRAALERARSLPPEEAPIAAVLGGGTVHWAP
ncbi:MAG: 6-phosphogluconolactonase [Sulfitobacter sp.]|nr:6-phosphogluconolactonase [Sulfitobacter sp.]